MRMEIPCNLDADGVHIKTGTETDSYVSIVQHMENKLENQSNIYFFGKDKWNSLFLSFYRRAVHWFWFSCN